MAYDVEANIYTCATGNTITFDCIKKDKTQSDLEMETSVYNCKDCASCPLKEMCIWAYGSKSPLTERSTVIYVSKRFARQLSETEKRINTTAGKLIRVVDTIDQDPAIVAEYEKRYQIFRGLYPALVPSFKAMAELNK